MGQNPAACCGSKCGQPTIVSIGDDVCPPRHPVPDVDPGLTTTDALPEWLSDLAPSLAGEEAERAADAWVRCGEELRRRTRQFVRRATCGVPCWFIDQRGGRTVPASYILDEGMETFFVETASPCEVQDAPQGQKAAACQDDSSRHVACECLIREIYNIWICADGELARRVHGTLRHGCDADLACVMLIDTPSGPIALVERSAEAREEFLDCMAVLVSAQRLRNEPEVAYCRHGAPPPEARLRPFGKSLQSAHISGPICVWLAQAAEGLLPTSQAALNFPGTEICPPRAVAAQEARRKDAILVDIDAPTQEGLLRKHAVTGAQLRVQGVTSGMATHAARKPNRGSPAPTDRSVTMPNGAAPGLRGAGEQPQGSGAVKTPAAFGGKLLAPAVVKLEKVSTAANIANGHAAAKTLLANALTSGDGAQDGLHAAFTGPGYANSKQLPTPGQWDPTPLHQKDSPRVREPHPSVDGMPMMMGGWIADQPQSSDPTILSKKADNHFVLPPGSMEEYPNTL